MLDSVTVTASDFAASFAFYDTALSALGLVRSVELVDEEEDGAPVEAAAWGEAGGPAALWLVVGRQPTTGLHVRLRARTAADVSAFYAAGTSAGGAPHSPPRRWPIYRPGEFLAIVRDPAGNLVEAVAPETAADPGPRG